MFKSNSYGFYTSLFMENMIKLYEESGKVNYRTYAYAEFYGIPF